MDVTQRFVEYALTATYDDLPAEALEAARLQLLDTLGVGLAGAAQAGVPEMLSLAAELEGAKQSSILGHDRMLTAPDAAQINATMIHALDFDDGHIRALIHASTITVPTIFAAAERMGGISGRDFLTAQAVGSDVICRLSLASKSAERRSLQGWHLTTLYGYLSSSIIASKVFNPSLDQAVNAFGIAYHQCAGNLQCVADGALTKRLGPGFAVRGGIMAALMAERGITGARHSLEGELGLYKLYTRSDIDEDVLLGDFGNKFHSAEISLKPYPCGGLIHPFIDAALELLQSDDVPVAEIEKIVLHHGEGTSPLFHPLDSRKEPRSAVDSQFSVPWAVAAAFAKGKVDLNCFTPEAITDESILSISRKVEEKLDPELNRPTGPEPGRIDLHLKNGNVLSQQNENRHGNREHVMSFDECVQKFLSCVDFSPLEYSQSTLEEVIDKIRNLESLSNATEIVHLLSCRGE